MVKNLKPGDCFSFAECDVKREVLHNTGHSIVYIAYRKIGAHTYELGYSGLVDGFKIWTPLEEILL